MSKNRPSRCQAEPSRVRWADLPAEHRQAAITFLTQLALKQIRGIHQSPQERSDDPAN
nr:hypothetical protein [Anaerolineae bacterium]